MIVVDTSALVAVLVEETASVPCREALKTEGELKISGGTVAEAMVVAEGRELGQQMRRLIGSLDFDVVPVTADFAYQVGEAFRYWGKGRHPAKLNYGDCFDYALAKQLDCPLLFIGNDFSKTDIRSAL